MASSQTYHDGFFYINHLNIWSHSKQTLRNRTWQAVAPLWAPLPFSRPSAQPGDHSHHKPACESRMWPLTHVWIILSAGLPEHSDRLLPFPPLFLHWCCREVNIHHRNQDTGMCCISTGHPPPSVTHQNGTCREWSPQPSNIAELLHGVYRDSLPC